MASNSTEYQESGVSLPHSGKLRILFLASEWGSSKGGLSTINRELAINIAKHPGMDVTFFVPRCNDEEKKAALGLKIKLVEASRVPGMKELQWLSFPPRDLHIDVVVGHGIKLGPQASGIKGSHKCKWVQVVHTVPEELGMHKLYANSLAAAEKKHKTEVELCQLADFVVSIGPKLNEAFCCYLSSCKKDKMVFNFTPGIFSEFLEVEQVAEREGQFKVLLFGRGDEEDFSVKGFDIAARAVASLDNIKLVFVGAPEDKLEEVKNRFLSCGIHVNNLIVRSFLQNRESLKDLFHEVDLAIMPSRTEGFGLTGLEALSAGVPILVSGNSGFGKALSEALFGPSFVVDSDDVQVWANAIKGRKDRDRRKRLGESQTLRSLYAETYSWEKQSKGLIQEMISLVQGSSTQYQSFTLQGASQQTEDSSVQDQATVPVVIELDSATFQDDHSGDLTPLMKEMANQFFDTMAAGIKNEEKAKCLFYYLEGVRGVKVKKAIEGSLIITVECPTLEILEQLWDDYCSGHLNAVVQEYLLTDDIKRRLHVEFVKLKTTIFEEDYLVCKQFLAERDQELSVKKELDLPQDYTQAAGETPSVSAVDSEPVTLHFSVNGKEQLSNMQRGCSQVTDVKQETFPEELANKEEVSSPVEEFPVYLQKIKLIHDSEPTKENRNMLRVAVECENPEILEQLWRDYRSGYLNVVAEKCLLTEDIKRRFHLTSVKFKTTILEKDYLACKDFLLSNTGLEQDPTNAEGKSTLSTVNSIIDEKNDSNKAGERLPAKKKSSAKAPVQPSVSEKKPVKEEIRLELEATKAKSKELAKQERKLQIEKSSTKAPVQPSVPEKKPVKEEIRLEQETMELEATKAKSKELAKQERKLQIEKSSTKAPVQPSVPEKKPVKEEIRWELEATKAKSKELAKQERKLQIEKSSTKAPVQPSVSEKKPVMNKKQRKYEEWRREKMKEEIRLELEEKRAKELAKQERKLRIEKNDKMEQAKGLPNYDVKTALEASGSGPKPSDKQTTTIKALGGARPKQVKTSNKAKTVHDKQDTKKQHKEAILNKISNMASETESDTLSSMNMEQMISPFDPCHGEGQSVWESSKPLNDSREPLFQDLAASNFIRECTQNASAKWGVDGETDEADSTKASDRSKSTPRPYPVHVKSKTSFQMCKHYASGMKCKESCTFAHGEEELSQWTMQRNRDIERTGFQDHEGLYRKPLHHDIQGSLRITYFREAAPRPPPTDVPPENLQLCKWWKNRRRCKTGRLCTFAHGKEELESWKALRSNEQQASSIRSREDLPFQSADISWNNMVHSLSGVEVTSDKPSSVKICHCDDVKRNVYDWVFSVTFEISAVGILRKIDLLHQYHNCYRLTKVESFLNDDVILSREPTDRWSFSLPSSLFDMKEGKMRVDIFVSFETEKFDHSFTQCLRFDFGERHYLLQGLNVDITSKEVLDTISVTREKLKPDPWVWTEELVNVFVSSEDATYSRRDKKLQKKYRLPTSVENVVSVQVMEGNIKLENYQRVMHQLLFTEELFMKKAISRFVVQSLPLHIQKSFEREHYGMAFAVEGELFGILNFLEAFQPDDAGGRLLVRNVQTAWLKLSETTTKNVYEALVEEVTSWGVVLRLSRQMCLALQLTDRGNVLVDLQFQLNRQPLCEWHFAIDRLGATHLSLLFPEQGVSEANEEAFSNYLPLNYAGANDEQAKAIKRIIWPSNNCSPLVVFGPFGTGKTFTLHHAIRQLVAIRNRRILLCTHTNSAADLHVEWLHRYLTDENGLKAAKPLRIYQKARRLEANSKIANQYALIVNNAYVLPTRKDVIDHRVVIATLATSKHLHELELNHGFFTHIFIDEAAQALEPEALTPLALAGPNTLVVLTGDHMQMRPEVYSHFARDWGLQRSLPERLFDCYCQTETEMNSNVMFLTKNYRCHPEILRFPSDNFYGGGGEQGKGLIACSKDTAHPQLGPLLFFSAYGMEEARENSYINEAEAAEVVKRVKELASDWPACWEERDLSEIGVITAYMAQVRAIRTLLRKENPELANVTVESVYNVQGKEFRAVFISTVRTSFSCQNFNGRVGFGAEQLSYWEFLSDSTLLNTAITRAKSLVAVVGEPVSLCTVGECRGNWRDYIKRCHDRKALYGTTFGELEKLISASVSRIPLNPEAHDFIPKSTTNTHEEEDKERGNASNIELEGDRENQDISQFPAQDQEYHPPGRQVVDENFIDERSVSCEDEQEELNGELSDSSDNETNTQDVKTSELNNTSQSIEIEDENGQCSLFLDEFRQESLEDEAVLPKLFNKIITAQFLEKCKETREEDARHQGSSHTFRSSKAVKRSQTGSKTETYSKQPARKSSRFVDGPIGDYRIRTVNGRQEFQLLDLRFTRAQSSLEKRLTIPLLQPNFLDPEVLHSVMLKNPKRYLPCTLRLNAESISPAYAEVSDTKTPDIRIKGPIRGVFDMDRVVVEKTGYQPLVTPGVLHSQGIIVGVLNHIISPHERQYVCSVDYENPKLMRPRNKSLPRIVPVAGKNECMPIYREIRESNEKIEIVDEIDLDEFRSGQFLFLVQFLQWRSDCRYPIGIIVRKLSQEKTLAASLKIVFAEHGIRKPFDVDTINHVRSEFPPSWSIPREEYRTRRKIDGAFTIDPDDSRDLDDALTMKQVSDEIYLIGVHIADVAYFVKEGTPLDREAFFRCTSYYPGHGNESIPMLPLKLSENLCSLLPDKDRLSLSLFFRLTKEGQLVCSPKIERTIVRSCCKLSYSSAQSIIDGQQYVPQGVSEDIKQKIQCLSFLAQKRRVTRMKDGAFDHWSNSDHDSYDFKAHDMVEEMMLLANEEVAKFLCEKLPDLAPIRAQLPPKDHRLKEWVSRYGQYIKYSFFLRSFYSEEDLDRMSKDAVPSNSKEFKVQKSIWSQICDAAISKDQGKLQFLICNDSHHPQLAVANSHFQRIQPKSQYVCKGEGDTNISHFSLGMPCYTHFTSPIRRYVDIQVHRLVLNIISQGRTTNEPSRERVAKVCRRSTFAHDNSRKFEKGCNKIHLAAQLKKKSHGTKAVIAMMDNQAFSLDILDKECNYLSTRQRKVNLSKLNPISSPFDQDGLGITLTWLLRMYIAPTTDMRLEPSDEKQEVEKLLCQTEGEKDEVFSLPGNNWQKIQEAFTEEDYETLGAVVAKTDKYLNSAKRQAAFESTRRQQEALNRKYSNDETKSGHFYEKIMHLRRFDVVRIQLTANTIQGTLHPEVQLFKINSRVHVCIEHRKYPRECFASTTRYQASKQRYSSLDDYIRAWKPVLAMEAATGAVDEGDEFTIHHLEVNWKKTYNGKVEGSFSIPQEYCTERQIEFFGGDFACVRVRQGDITLGTQLGDSRAGPLKSERISSKRRNSSRGRSCADSNSFWVGHCIVKSVHELEDSLEVTIDLHQSSSNFPEELETKNHKSVLTLIHRSFTHRRMFSALCDCLENASPLVHAICLGLDPVQEEFADVPSSDHSIVREQPTCGLKLLNQYQEEAVREALVKPLTLVQGPPGTGKTVTGVHMAYWFTKRNLQLLSQEDRLYTDPEPPEVPPQVIYCGPSNKSVDVVARKMLQIPDLKIIRVYGDRKEEADFPTPNRLKPLKNSTDDEDHTNTSDQEIKKVSLHHVIRENTCPFASEIGKYERKFAADRKAGVRSKDNEVAKYNELIGRAKEWVLTSSGVQVILCTCAVAGSRIVSCCKNIRQCIVDECGMCLELESLVPIRFSRARQVVLIGDHKQLQPVILDDMAKKLGLNVSMFERLSTRSIMLELQYRMHENICRFPSDYFYEGQLKTDQTVPNDDPLLQFFWPAQRIQPAKNLPIAFCHVEGEEETSAIKTSHSNEQSKANTKEVEKVTNVVRCLVKKGVHQESIVILTPYREQRQRISDALKKGKYKEVLVTTITKSQGSEWDYVIISLVRSMKEEDIEREPSLSWLREHLGFVTDDHQMNVGITRARRGLCIIGNKILLSKHAMWQTLLEFYEENNCVVNESDWP